MIFLFDFRKNDMLIFIKNQVNKNLVFNKNIEG